MLLKNKGIRHIFYQEKDATKKEGLSFSSTPIQS